MSDVEELNERLKGIVIRYFRAKYALEYEPQELRYAVDETFETYGAPDTLDDAIEKVTWVFQCEWDASIEEFTEIWDDRDKKKGV